jgi:hypothetical protein
MSHIRKCANCGNQFKTTYDSKIYCSAKCKQCAEHRRYRHAHKDKFREYASTPKRREYIRAYRKKYCQEHKVQLRAKAREQYERHRDERIQYGRDYRKKNAVRLKQYWKERYDAKKKLSTVVRKCVVCGKQFESTHNRRIYCSKECKAMRQNKSGKKNLAEYQKKYYQTHRKELLQRAKDYRLTHRDKVRELQKKLYQMGKTSALKICAECGKRFKPSSKMNTICSDKCRVKRWRECQNKYYKNNPERRGKQYVAKVGKFYAENPFAIYMPERKKAVEKSAEVHGYGVGNCKRCGERFVKMSNTGERYCGTCRRILYYTPASKRERTVLSDRQIIALANFDAYKEVNELEKIDLETLRGVPSAEKDAIIEALFNALKAKKEVDMAQKIQPRERKVSKKGKIYLEFNKMKDGEYVSFDEMVEKMSMSPLTVWNGIYCLMKAGYVSMSIVKLSPMPSDWLEKQIYFGWKK